MAWKKDSSSQGVDKIHDKLFREEVQIGYKDGQKKYVKEGWQEGMQEV